MEKIRKILKLSLILIFGIFCNCEEEILDEKEAANTNIISANLMSHFDNSDVGCGFTVKTSDKLNSQSSYGRHYSASTLVSDENLPIKVFSNISEPPGIPSGTSWNLAISQAIGDWNSFSSCQNLFTIVNNAQDAQITINGPDDIQGGWPSGATHIFGWVDGNPSCGQPFNEVLINTNFEYANGTEPSQINMQNIVGHELGHAIGFRHTDGNEGTVIPNTENNTDPDSIMHSSIVNRTMSGLTGQDILSTKYLYGCNSSGNDDVGDSTTINAIRPRPFCYTENFNVNGTFVVCDNDSTNIQLCIYESESFGSPPIYCSTTTSFSNGVFNFTDLNLSQLSAFDVDKNYKAVITLINGDYSIYDTENLFFTTDCNNNDQCEESEFYYIANSLGNGYSHLAWNNPNNEEYLMEFVVDYSCIDGETASGNDGLTYTTYTNNSQISFWEIRQNALGRTYRFRYKKETCEWSQYCCISPYPGTFGIIENCVTPQ